MSIRINIAKSAGFCVGVKRALSIALESAKKTHKVSMLGDIVHNEDVVHSISGAGIKKISKLKKVTNHTLLIRAHGMSKKRYASVKDYGYTIIDATCPMVKEIHGIALKNEKKGYKIIIIGDENHDEVKGISGQLKNKPLIITNQRLPLAKLKKITKCAIVVQSTQNFDKTLITIAKIEKLIKKVIFFNTICQPTRIKQDEIKKMPKKNDLMLIIGSHTSANTKRLFQISKNLNPNTYWIQSEKNLQNKWFKDISSVGITAGASTPQESIHLIVKTIKSIVKGKK